VGLSQFSSATEPDSSLIRFLSSSSSEALRFSPSDPPLINELWTLEFHRRTSTLLSFCRLILPFVLFLPESLPVLRTFLSFILRDWFMACSNEYEFSLLLPLPLPYSSSNIKALMVILNFLFPSLGFLLSLLKTCILSFFSQKDLFMEPLRVNSMNKGLIFWLNSQGFFDLDGEWVERTYPTHLGTRLSPIGPVHDWSQNECLRRRYQGHHDPSLKTRQFA